jgi:uncharacterized membrane protein
MPDVRQPSRALAVLASMAVAVLVVAAAASPVLDPVVIAVGLGLGAAIGGVSVAAYQLTRRSSITVLAAALAGALLTFGLIQWRNDDEGEPAIVAVMGAILGLLCVAATLLVLRADLPDEQR